MNLLARNSKIKNSANSKYIIYNFGIPAFLSADGTKTCPNAKACVAGCYARSGFYRISNVAKAYEKRLQASKKVDFALRMIKEIRTKELLAKKNGQQLVIRIHDSGDFYSLAYLTKWRMIIRACPDVHFYCYTKMVHLFRWSSHRPNNFHVIFSLGGKEDHLINLKTDTHSRVFESRSELRGEGYKDASKDDLVAAFGKGPIGLVYHGQKAYENTGWDRDPMTYDKEPEINRDR